MRTAEGGKLRAHVAGLTSWLAQSAAGAMASSGAGPAPSTWRLPTASSVAPDGPFSPAVTAAAMESAFADGVVPVPRGDAAGRDVPSHGTTFHTDLLHPPASTADARVSRALFGAGGAPGTLPQAGHEPADGVLLTPGMTLTMAEMDATQPPATVVSASTSLSAPGAQRAPAPPSSASVVAAATPAPELAGESQFVGPTPAAHGYGGAATARTDGPGTDAAFESGARSGGARNATGSSRANGASRRRVPRGDPPMIAEVDDETSAPPAEATLPRAVAGVGASAVEGGEDDDESGGGSERDSVDTTGPIVVTVARGVASSRNVLASAPSSRAVASLATVSSKSHRAHAHVGSSRHVPHGDPVHKQADAATSGETVRTNPPSGQGGVSKLTHYLSGRGRSTRDVREYQYSPGESGAAGGGAPSPIGRDVFDPADEPPPSGRGIAVSKLLAHIKHGVPLPSHHTRPDGDGVWGEVAEEAKAERSAATVAATSGTGTDAAAADTGRTPSRSRTVASAQPIALSSAASGTIDRRRQAASAGGGPSAPTLTAFARTVLAGADRNSSGAGAVPASRLPTPSAGAPQRRDASVGALSPLQRALGQKPVYVKSVPEGSLPALGHDIFTLAAGAGSHGHSWTTAHHDTSMLRASALQTSEVGAGAGDESRGWGPDATVGSVGSGYRRGGSRVVLTHDVV